VGLNYRADLSELNSVSIIGGNLFINNNENLTSFSGLDNLTYVEGHLNIGYWESIIQPLTSLNGLESLDSIGEDLDIINHRNDGINTQISNFHFQPDRAGSPQSTDH
jgi:hypothetical protein